ncbi:uncharacterized protein LOC115740739 [Rhodamnia argentea]|uniref:Uncharacterized protein LOC115740739 n=1 Tax=Rhodamnia argentea TaxID=178133 RepID=A0A8B8P601_9MYRT|nr:uncharacterized protein LOC115740739 [Rhodamnia argentea]
MLLRSSLSNTKKFFRRTIESFTSFLSCGNYQKLPKTPSPCVDPYNNANGSSVYPPPSKDLDRFYTDFTGRRDSDKGNQHKAKKRSMDRAAAVFMDRVQEKATRWEENPPTKFSMSKPTTPSKNDHRERREWPGKKMVRSSSSHDRRREGSSCSKSAREARSGLIAQKLKELERMDMSNIDHVLDVEEVLHYYSLLTCPAYLEIVDKFFTEMYDEFFGALMPTAHASRGRSR